MGFEKTEPTGVLRAAVRNKSAGGRNEVLERGFLLYIVSFIKVSFKLPCLKFRLPIMRAFVSRTGETISEASW